MKQLKILTHNPNSVGAANLAQAITSASENLDDNQRVSAVRLKRDSVYKKRNKHFILNYGVNNNRRLYNHLNNNEPPIPQLQYVFNKPEAVTIAGNKKIALEKYNQSYILRMAGNGEARPIPFTTSQAQAQRWCDEGIEVVCRHILNGHSGEGIEIVLAGQEVPPAPLYTMYIKKKSEYRVHIIKININGENSYRYRVQKKLRDTRITDPNWRVRNHENGFIYSSNIGLSIEQSNRLNATAILALESAGLDFAAVDIIVSNNSDYNQRHGIQANYMHYLETNTAPGLSAPSLLRWYGESFVEAVNHRYGELND